ncbi:MAG: acyl-CoA dehydrogenase [Novosphingobium sp.]|nr:acyl-CoA dehydrogenase [Novosphingobium sp.]
MDLHPGDEIETLRSATAEWLAGRLPLAAARRSPPGLWDELEAMGWPVMTLAEDRGGLALDHASEAVVFAELGRHLAPLAMVATAVARRWTLLPAKCALAIPAGDGALRALDPEGADVALVARADELATVEISPGPARATIDLTTLQARVPGAPGAPIAGQKAVLHLRLLLAAYALGAADAARDMAVDYAKLRVQFGQPIGAFQAIKHICADMAVGCAVARSQLYYAACALGEDAADAAFHVLAAHMLALRAALANGRANIQVHGGIGMTDEAQAHLPLKRAHLLGRIIPPGAGILLG